MRDERLTDSVCTVIADGYIAIISLIVLVNDSSVSPGSPAIKSVLIFSKPAATALFYAS